MAARYHNRPGYAKRIKAAASALADRRLLRRQEIPALVLKALAFYDRVMAHDPADRSCAYLAPQG